MTGTLWHLAAALMLFVGSHFALSAPPIRKAIVGVTGERSFVVAYSIVSLVLLVWVVKAYNGAPITQLWVPPTGLRHLSLLLMLISCLLVAAGLLTPNPTAVGKDTLKLVENGPHGIFAITRHPVLWGIGLWGVAHFLANGDAASMLLFAAMTVLAVAGTAAIDAKKRRSLGDAWEAYCAETSSLPFAAVVSKRTRIRFAEIGFGRLAAGVALYVLLIVAHPWLFGADPWPL